LIVLAKVVGYCLMPPSLFDQAETNDLICDFNLPKQSSELLASRLQERHLLHPGTNVTFYRNREQEIFQFFASSDDLVYFHHLKSLLEAMD